MSAARRHNAPEPGLCGGCAAAARVISGRGSAFLRCGRHDSDPSFAKYPPLPVRSCAGFEPRGAPADAGAGGGEQRG